MAAYNFKTRFIEPIRGGVKTQTIRPIGRRVHAKPGGRLQLYTGMRTAKCEKILATDPVCLEVLPVRLDFRRSLDPLIFVDQSELTRKQAEQFARADGFESLKEMGEIFTEIYGAVRDGMLVIKWGLA
jgi:hypothetical protein